MISGFLLLVCRRQRARGFMHRVSLALLACSQPWKSTFRHPPSRGWSGCRNDSLWRAHPRSAEPAARASWY